MFNLFNKYKNLDGVIMAPVNGRCIDLSEVPDKVFSERMIGDGVAFIPEDDIICSPCNGTVVMIAATSHAIGIKSKEVEILIHIGLDTVELNGEGFEVLVKTDQKVKLGTPLLRIDRKFMKEKSMNLTTPMIITNNEDFKLEFKNIGKEVEGSKSEAIKYTKSK
ncbi:PTS sugar transporter subunit IIA [Clostridium polynesiense]|uniref:PTS sugar transporter subunit IIA n=1 Tax=Clostridium polynesiense TaxID=1325933 RepID=UPI00059058B5|nr:PTS glucose transporter subunit IIA [Clostridium polynesiense]